MSNTEKQGSTEGFHIGKPKQMMKTTYNDTLPKTEGFFPIFSKRNEGEAVLDNLDELKGFDRSSNALILYNRFINCVDPLYGNLKPHSGIIIRSFVKDQMFTEGGLYKGIGKQKVEVATLQRGGYTKDVVNDPFGFSEKCIIVAVPEHEELLKPGQIHAYKRARVYAPVAGQSDVFDYDNSFLHPDSGYVHPPTDPTNRHFGYMLASRGILLAGVEPYSVDVINIYKNFSDEIDAIYKEIR